MNEDPLFARADAAIRDAERLKEQARANFEAIEQAIGRHRRAAFNLENSFRDASRANLARLPPTQPHASDD